MKKLYLSLLSILNVAGGLAQTSDSLIVLDLSANTFRSGHLLSNSKSLVITDTLPFLGFSTSGHTYDILLENMYLSMDQRIVEIDARSGLMLDTLASGIPVHAFESALGPNNLIALHVTPSGLAVYGINTSSKVTSTLNTIGSINAVLGRATMDILQSRLYIKTSLGITSIDALTGNLLDTIFDSKNLLALEFHPGTQLLYGVFWNGSQEVLCSLDPTTKMYTDIGILNGVTSINDLSTMDITGGRYILETNLGTTFIDIQNGAITDTMEVGNLLAYEYINRIGGPSAVAKYPQADPVLVYPNPAQNAIHVEGIEPGTAYQVWNISGQLVQEGTLPTEGIDLTRLSAGMYQLRFSNGGSVKLIRQP